MLVSDHRHEQMPGRSGVVAFPDDRPPEHDGRRKEAEVLEVVLPSLTGPRTGEGREPA